MKNALFSLCVIIGALQSCKKDDDSSIDNPQLEFSLAFDKTLPRLGNFGEEVAVPDGHASQSPNMKEVSLHYIELAKDSLTPLSKGAIVYTGVETAAGGDKAVDFDKAMKAKDGETFVSLNLSDLPAGTYEWIRVSLTYQKYDIAYRLNVDPYIVNQDFTGTLSSFVGFNTYITSHMISDSLVKVNANKLQGYWAFETSVDYNGEAYGSVHKGDGAVVTVVNPISATSPVPAGSCVVTGKLAEPLIITGTETLGKHVVLAFSINNSFEWVDVVSDGKYEPGAGETVADMGLRGLHPYVKK